MAIEEIKDEAKLTYLAKLVGSYPNEKPWESKTAIMATVTILAPWVYPPLSGWIVANPQLFSSMIGAILLLLKTMSWTVNKK